MKYSFNYSDNDYKDAINCHDTTYYNYPITINIDSKKFMLPVGSSDRLKVKIDKTSEYVYIVGENSGLDYISLTVIDLSDNSVQSAYLSGNDINDKDAYSYGILNKSTKKQIEILSKYL